jgi:hypothetical protein
MSSFSIPALGDLKVGREQCARWREWLQVPFNEPTRCGVSVGGSGYENYAMNIRAADASVNNPPKAINILPTSEVRLQDLSSSLLATAE